MRLILDLLIVTLIAAGVGLGLTAYAIEHPPELDVLRSGSWLAFPSSGTAGIDAYRLAALAHNGEVPLAIGDGIAFTAGRDDAGAKLRANCSYLVAGPMPNLRAWTVSVETLRGQLIDNPAGRHAFTSAEVLRTADRAVAIAVSPEPQPGNWLPTSGDEATQIVLRFYDTTVGALSGGRAVPQLPSVTRTGCR